MLATTGTSCYRLGAMANLSPPFAFCLNDLLHSDTLGAHRLVPPVCKDWAKGLDNTTSGKTLLHHSTPCARMQGDNSDADKIHYHRSDMSGSQQKQKSKNRESLSFPELTHEAVACTLLLVPQMIMSSNDSRSE